MAQRMDCTSADSRSGDADTPTVLGPCAEAFRERCSRLFPSYVCFFWHARGIQRHDKLRGSDDLSACSGTLWLAALYFRGELVLAFGFGNVVRRGLFVSV